MLLHKKTLRTKSLVCTAATLFTLVGGHSLAAVSNLPLSTVTGVPSNVLFILDDSGSMEWDFINNPDISSISGTNISGSSSQYSNSGYTAPGDNATNIYGRNYVTNTLMYDPSKSYLPWMQSSGTRMTGGTSYSSAFSGDNNVSGSIDLALSTRTFYVPKSGITNKSDITQYYRYQIHTDGVIVRSEWANSGSTGLSGRGCNNSGWTWRGCTQATPTGRTEADERTNYATWYSYHRTRMKVAKAGASEAFNELGTNVRVGFRGLGNNDGTNEPYDIPVGDGNNGLFTGTARSTWFSRLQSTRGDNGTPLRSALKSAGQYFSNTNSTGPYGPETTANQWACRQNYTILTTDGYWNGSSPSNIGNQDGTDGATITGPNSETYTYDAGNPYEDTNSNTLADVAMRYWKNDLRTDLDNLVTTSDTDPAFWQHMVTFGISIGLKGTLDQSSVEEVLADGSPRDGGVDVSWPTPSDDSVNNIDDLLHAAVNGHGTFVSASNPDEFKQGLQSALSNIVDRVGSGSALAANSTKLETDTVTFQAQYRSGTWRGELNAYRVASDGSLSTSPWTDGKGAGQLLNSVASSSRNIYVYNPQGGTANTKYDPFTWDNLGSTQRTALGSTTTAQQNVVSYLRGDRSLERSRGGTLRTRTGVLGDIVNSTPVYVGAPNARLYASSTFTGASSYSAFVSANTGTNERTSAVYVGANDGMLHAFNADTGAEIYAFVPNTAILSGLKQYSELTYSHRYFVDGEIAAADFYDTSDNDWKTVLVGTLGRGGPGVFALDVTDPPSTATPDSVKFLWEKNGTDIAALGKNIGKPVIAQVADGDWRVLIGNGPESSSGSAQLIMIRLRDGNVTVVNTGATGSNGLTAVLARDSDGDGFSDTAYAGDLLGNLWKFSNLSGSPSATKLFQALDGNGNAQPITAAPLVGKDPATGQNWVFFGTGRYLSDSDLSDTQVQTWYGIKDNGASISGRSDLVERSILDEAVIAGTDVRVIEEGTVAELQSKQGWYMDLKSPDSGAEGERMVVPNRFQGSVLIGTTRIPDASDLCRPSGRGFVMAINPFTGARLATTFFDVNGDGIFNAQDMLNGVPVTGIGFDSSPNSPIFIENIMQVGLEDGSTKAIKTQGSAVESKRMSWRELVN